ncbi:unnamed protein product [Urochloa humidicola]
MPRLQVLLWLLLLPSILVLSVLSVPASATVVLSEPAPATPPGCPSLCGGVTIYYPFGLNKGCSWDESFTLSCNDSFSPARLYYGEVEVKNIMVETGEMHVFTGVTSICFSAANQTFSSYRPDSGTLLDLTGSPLQVSQGKNEFTAIGCYTLALLGGKEPGTYLSGCISTCASVGQANTTINDKGCTGIGCCKIDIPSNLSYIRVDWSVSTNSKLTNLAWRYSPCSYTLVAQKGWTRIFGALPSKYYSTHLTALGRRHRRRMALAATVKTSQINHITVN